MEGIDIQDSVPDNKSWDTASFNRRISWIAAGVYIILIAVSFICGRFFRKSVVGTPKLTWKYNDFVTDNLPPGYEWVRDNALACNVDDEGASVYIKDITGDRQPEVIFDYQLDGIHLPNHQFLDVYSKDGKQALLKSTDLIMVGYGFTKINKAVAIYGYGLRDNFAVGYVFNGERYVSSTALAIMAWFWRIACILAWCQFSFTFDPFFSFKIDPPG